MVFPWCFHASYTLRTQLLHSCLYWSISVLEAVQSAVLYITVLHEMERSFICVMYYPGLVVVSPTVVPQCQPSAKTVCNCLVVFLSSAFLPIIMERLERKPWMMKIKPLHGPIQILSVGAW